MGVLIRGMEMPTSCDDCRLNNGISCYAVPEYMEDGVVGRTDDRPNWCPLVPIPPHGRLIDAGALMERFEKEEKAADEHGRDFSFSFKSGGQNCTEWWSVQNMLMDAPTIIEAEVTE